MQPLSIDPVIFSLGPLQVRWYGMMYVLGFVIGGFLLRKLVDRGYFKVEKKRVDTLVTTILVCMFIGARLAYVFIYNWDYYAQNPGDIIAVWKGGLSFHGALAGILTAGYIFARRFGISWAQVMDVIALAGSQGLFWGRMGNFINGELYGRVTDSPFGIVFATGGPYPRHPSQLYEGVMEGIVLSIVLWLMLRKVKNYGYIASMFLILYGLFRFGVEFFREADAQLGYYFGGTTTMGQILCMVMMLIGSLALYLSFRKKFTN